MGEQADGLRAEATQYRQFADEARRLNNPGRITSATYHGRVAEAYEEAAAIVEALEAQAVPKKPDKDELTFGCGWYYRERFPWTCGLINGHCHVERQKDRNCCSGQNIQSRLSEYEKMAEDPDELRMKLAAAEKAAGDQ
ncbi:MAG: hypothetical protein KAJ19_23060 [Gammaproteobacteria bacterium]|nr:hypothetical protein [Gammaproteobacteria bacterium]